MIFGEMKIELCFRFHKKSVVRQENIWLKIYIYLVFNIIIKFKNILKRKKL